MRCKFSLFSCRGCVALPLENFENQEYRRSHLWPFCNAIKILRLPEFSIFVDVSDVSEKKVTIVFAFKCRWIQYRSVYVMVDIRSNIYQYMCTYNHIRFSTAFLRKCMAKVILDNILKKVVYIQVGISTSKLERIILAGFIKTGKGCAKIRVAEKRYGENKIYFIGFCGGCSDKIFF